MGKKALPTLQLLKNISVDNVLTSVPAQLAGHNPRLCQTGQSWVWDGVKFTFLSPDHAFVSDNDNSCALRIETAQSSVLLTGDIEAEAEHNLVTRYGNKLKASVLIAPHHGSKTSSTREFLDAVAPDTIIVPAGYLNQFGHPHPEVLARYQQINAKVFNTATSGAVSFHGQYSTAKVFTFRDTDGKYWNNKSNID